eukprot:UN24645
MSLFNPQRKYDFISISRMKHLFSCFLEQTKASRIGEYHSLLPKENVEIQSNADFNNYPDFVYILHIFYTSCTGFFSTSISSHDFTIFGNSPRRKFKSTFVKSIIIMMLSSL